MEELKKCPFCRSEAIIYENHKYNDAYMVGCKGFCKVEPMTDWCETKEEAIVQWNTRKPMERIVEKLEEVLERHWGYYDKAKSEGDIRQMDYCDGYIEGLKTAIEIVKEELI